jgi:hypothetical protein
MGVMSEVVAVADMEGFEASCIAISSNRRIGYGAASHAGR